MAKCHLLIHTSVSWVVFINPSGQLLHANCSTENFHTCHAYRYNLVLPFHFMFTDLDLTFGSQGQHEAKPVSFIFSHTFHLIKLKFDVVIKQFMLNIVKVLLSKICRNKGNNCCCTGYVKRIYTFGRLHISLIQIWSDDRYCCTLHVDTRTLTLMQGHRSVSQQNLLHQLSHKILNRFEWNLVYFWDLLAWWTSPILFCPL